MAAGGAKEVPAGAAGAGIVGNGDAAVLRDELEALGGNPHFAHSGADHLAGQVRHLAVDALAAVFLRQRHGHSIRGLGSRVNSVSPEDAAYQRKLVTGPS